MNAEKFIRMVREAIVESNASLYRRYFTSPLPPAASDRAFLLRHEFMSRMTPADQEVIIGMMRQAAIDSISKFFGALDGTSRIGESVLNLKLLDQHGNLLNGDLQDLFLEQIEELE